MVSEADVATIARDHLSNWESLRPYLELSRQQEKEIHNTYHDYGRQKCECLEVWKELKGNKATYGALIKAAEQAKNQQLADRVKAMLFNSEEIDAKDQKLQTVVKDVKGPAGGKVHVSFHGVLL